MIWNESDEVSVVRVCLIEDDEDDFVIVRDLLRDIRRTTFSIEWVSQVETARQKLVSRNFDVFLLDYRLGPATGLELLEQADPQRIGAPVILLTGQKDLDVDLQAAKAGAADYLLKNRLDPDMLERSIRYALERYQTLEALRVSEERYALSARGANDGLWVWDLALDRIFFSVRWKSMLGFEEDEISDSPDDWFMKVHPEDIVPLRQALELHRTGATPHFEQEYRIIDREGSWRWMLSRGLAVRDADDRAVRIAGSQTDTTERKAAVEQILHDALHDSLTDLPNRALFMDRLERAMLHHKRRDKYLFAVLFIDLDRFKLVNDSLGHAMGDRLLIEVGKRLQKSIQSNDTVARLGGDEFTVLLDDMNHLNEAARVAERILRELSVPIVIDRQEMYTTASIGIALSSSNYERPADILRDADTAMYRAKARGKARHEVFDQAMHADAVTLLQTETDLRRALDREELRLHYQPIISLETGHIEAFEALLRWERDGELLLPQEFIAIAEETGLIIQIGDWVLENALEQVARWNVDRQLPLRVNVNLSPKQFLQRNLVGRVEELLQRYEVQPEWLNLEVTESVLFEDSEAAGVMLDNLRGLGVKLSLDDFGTGYSSLSVLHRFPFHTLKVDRSFVSGSGNVVRNAAIVRTVTSLAATLGMRVVAEGVESADQLATIRSLGCDGAQGFFFGKGLPVVEADEMIRLTRSWNDSPNALVQDASGSSSDN